MKDHEHTPSKDCPCLPEVEDYRAPTRSPQPPDQEPDRSLRTVPGAGADGVDPGEVTITCNEDGDCVAVTRTDREGRIVKVLWERGLKTEGHK